MKHLQSILLLIQVFIFQYGFTQKNVDIQEILSSIQDSTTKAVLANPATFRYQIVYTQINRDKNADN